MKKLIFLLVFPFACEEITYTEQTISTGDSPGFSVIDFGATGDGITDDSKAFQDAVNAAIEVGGGELIIPHPDKFYNIKNTINIAPATGAQCFINIMGYGIPKAQIHYTGGGNKSVFKIVGLKSSIITGVKVWVVPGISGVVVWDIDTTPESPSTSLVTFKQCNSLLGNGANNVGWRLGHKSGGGADISNYQWENCAAYGNQDEGNVVQGQVGWLFEGRNTLQNSWFGGFGAFLDRIYSNLSQPGTGATYQNGNGSVFFYGLGGSHNNVDFEIAAEQVYHITGGRFEVGKKFLLVPDGVEDPSITVNGVIVDGYSPPDGNIIHMGRSGTLILEGCIMSGENDFTKMITLGGERSKGRLFVRGGSYASPKPFYKILKGTWQVNIQSVGKLDGPYATEYFDNEPPN
jgi:hypothetical protein